MFFNEQGMLNLDEAVMNQPTFKKIMEDGIVTEQEIKEQSERIVSILKSMEKNYTEDNSVKLKNCLLKPVCYLQRANIMHYSHYTFKNRIMGTFATKKILQGNPSLIPVIAEQIKTEFAAEQFEVQIDNLLSGGVDISISKGGLFKAVLGLKSALKVSLIPKDNAIAFEAGIGIFGQQAIPTIISMLFFWPVLITQIWGIVQQSKLDDKALEIAEEVLKNRDSFTTLNLDINGMVFCTNCGYRNIKGAKFCSECGQAL